MDKKEINKIKKLIKEVESVGNGKIVITDGKNFFSGDEFDKMFDKDGKTRAKNSMPEGIANFLGQGNSMEMLKATAIALKKHKGDAVAVADHYYETCKATTECFVPLIKKDIDKQAKDAKYTKKDDYLKTNAIWMCYLDCVIIESLKLIRYLLQCRDVKNAKEVIVKTLERILKDVKEKEL